MLRPIKEFGSPLFDTIQPTTYCDLNGMFDAAYPKGMLYYWKSNFLTSLDDDLINTIIEMVRTLSFEIQRHLSGALAWRRSSRPRRTRQLFTIVAKATIC